MPTKQNLYKNKNGEDNIINIFKDSFKIENENKHKQASDSKSK